VRIVVVGAGGLGGPIALATAAAGAELTILDADVVEVSNLHRQVQFVMTDLGQPKAHALASRCGARARGRATRFTAATADELGADCDVIVDGSDDPATKFAVADWARARGRAHVIASALRYGGNVFAGAAGTACYRCLFEDPPDDAPTCADAGVLGPLVGWIGGVAAGRALALAAGDRSAGGTLWFLDDLRRGRPPRQLALARRPGCACEAT
jgi:adenylyltransferase/sulfurtransferase